MQYSEKNNVSLIKDTENRRKFIRVLLKNIVVRLDSSTGSESLISIQYRYEQTGFYTGTF